MIEVRGIQRLTDSYRYLLTDARGEFSEGMAAAQGRYLLNVIEAEYRLREGSRLAQGVKLRIATVWVCAWRYLEALSEAYLSPISWWLATQRRRLEHRMTTIRKAHEAIK